MALAVSHYATVAFYVPIPQLPHPSSCSPQSYLHLLKPFVPLHSRHHRWNASQRRAPILPCRYQIARRGPFLHLQRPPLVACPRSILHCQTPEGPTPAVDTPSDHEPSGSPLQAPCRSRNLQYHKPWYHSHCHPTDPSHHPRERRPPKRFEPETGLHFG